MGARATADTLVRAGRAGPTAAWAVQTTRPAMQVAPRTVAARTQTAAAVVVVAVETARPVPAAVQAEMRGLPEPDLALVAFMSTTSSRATWIQTRRER